MKRLTDGPPDVSPRTLGDEGSPAHTTAEGAATASFLRGSASTSTSRRCSTRRSRRETSLGSRAFSRNPAS